MQFIPSAAIPQPQPQMQASPGAQVQAQVQQVQPQVQWQFLNPQLLYAAQQTPLQPGMMGGGAMAQQVGGQAAVARDASMAGTAQAQVATPQLQQAPQQQMPQQQLMAQPQQLQAQQYQVPSHMQQQQQLYYGSVDLGRPLV